MVSSSGYSLIQIIKSCFNLFKKQVHFTGGFDFFYILKKKGIKGILYRLEHGVVMAEKVAAVTKKTIGGVKCLEQN